MEPDFWHQRWAANEIGFHGSATNPMLLKHFAALALDKGRRVFLPLCGKSLDIHWLLANGYRVAGAELSRLAVEQLFAELGAEPSVSRCGSLEHYSVRDLDIFVGDIFDLSADLLGPVDATYDRAALVALPEGIRGRYAAHLTAITANAPQLLLCFEYDQRLMDGPPFSLTNVEVMRLYRETYKPALLESFDIPGGFRGRVAATEHVWLLRR
ncbi:MAG TPA: thiopurine S-methyltransferase [Rhodocyclaceae bacterium]|nr:thiopurine S-methyltransferase [Rhodocyclaceae bacterium]